MKKVSTKRLKKKKIVEDNTCRDVQIMQEDATCVSIFLSKHAFINYGFLEERRKKDKEMNGKSLIQRGGGGGKRKR